MIIDFHVFVDNFVSAIEAKDSYTAGHSDRVADLCMVLAKALNLEEDVQYTIHMAAHLHDIGKIGIPDGILLKSGKLTQAEFEVMKSHSEIGYNILKNNIGLKRIAQMILHHHERYDGTGYPSGIKGEKIPIGSRIISVCDAFDAMVTRRTYNETKSIEAAIEEIRSQSGKHFDPKIAETFISILGKDEVRKEIEAIISIE